MIFTAFEVVLNPDLYFFIIFLHRYLYFLYFRAVKNKDFTVINFVLIFYDVENLWSRKAHVLELLFPSFSRKNASTHSGLE